MTAKVLCSNHFCSSPVNQSVAPHTGEPSEKQTIQKISVIAQSALTESREQVTQQRESIHPSRIDQVDQLSQPCIDSAETISQVVTDNITEAVQTKKAKITTFLSHGEGSVIIPVSVNQLQNEREKLKEKRDKLLTKKDSSLEALAQNHQEIESKSQMIESQIFQKLKKEGFDIASDKIPEKLNPRGLESKPPITYAQMRTEFREKVAEFDSQICDLEKKKQSYESKHTDAMRPLTTLASPERKVKLESQIEKVSQEIEKAHQNRNEAAKSLKSVTIDAYSQMSLELSKIKPRIKKYKEQKQILINELSQLKASNNPDLNGKKSKIKESIELLDKELSFAHRQVVLKYHEFSDAKGVKFTEVDFIPGSASNNFAVQHSALESHQQGLLSQFISDSRL